MRTVFLTLLLVLGVGDAPTVAPVQAVVKEAPARTLDASAYQLVGEGQRVGRPGKSLAGPKWFAAVNAAESTLAPFGAGPTEAAVAAQAPVNGGWIDDCPCGPDCLCIDPAICKAGDCKRNYIVLFTMKGCAHCPAQKAIADELQRDGYIVYVVDWETHIQVASELKITMLPTTLVFDEGKEVARYVGLTRAARIKQGVKKRDEQKPVPTPDPYDFSVEKWPRL